MKKFKKFTALFLVILFSLSLFSVCVYAEESGITEFSVTAETDGKEIKVNWWNGGSKYYIFMPSDVELKDVTVDFTASSAVFMGADELISGENVSFETDKDYTLICRDKEYVFTVMQSAGLPSLHITTESGSMDAVHSDKSHKEPASIVIANEGEVVLEKDLEYIKGRGNASWSYVKKPYNIKFDKKTDLFGMGKAKKWTLLANYVDKTVMRNHVALSLGHSVGIDFTSDHVYVDLYIDNEYYGSYILCESVEVGETRVDISDLEGETEDVNPDIELDECELGGARENNYRALVAGTQKWAEIPVNPENITGGYLLEYELPDRYINEASGFVTNRNQPIVVKAPEYASQAQVQYISSLYQEFEDAVYSETGYNSLGRHYTEYIDTESFARMYVFQEYVKNLDAGITSFFICKDKDSDKFVAAPIWDFDRALGDNFERFGMNTATPEGWWAGVIYHWSDNAVKTLPTILNALYRQDDFFGLAKDEWNNVFSPLLNEEYIKNFSDFSFEIEASAVMNAVRWNSFGTFDYESTAAEYRKFIQSNLIEFMKNRKAFLDKGFSETSVRIFFDANGGKGNMLNKDAVLKGDTFVLPECIFTHSGLVFDSWNTKADGTGITYVTGQEAEIDTEKCTFYAQWKEKEVQPPVEPEGPSEKLNFFEKLIQLFREFFAKLRAFFQNLFA